MSLSRRSGPQADSLKHSFTCKEGDEPPAVYLYHSQDLWSLKPDPQLKSLVVDAPGPTHNRRRPLAADAGFLAGGQRPRLSTVMSTDVVDVQATTD
jgi:hypothetical protein